MPLKYSMTMFYDTVLQLVQCLDYISKTRTYDRGIKDLIQFLNVTAQKAYIDKYINRL